MNTETGNEQNPPPFAPPVAPGALAPPDRPSSWPKIIGIIALILGSLGILGGACGALMSGFMGRISDAMPKEAAASFEFMKENQGWTLLATLISTGVAGFLLAGGIGLVNRRSYGVRMCMIYAVLQIPAAGLGAWVQYRSTQAQFGALQEQDANIQALPGGIFDAFGIFVVAFTLLWGWALPVFLLIWFKRQKIRSEVAAWN